jgi:UDP-N-acetyl-D-galactosamine dehydrogenase
MFPQGGSVSKPFFQASMMNENTVAVVGLGYVGLPLAVAFARHFNTLGFDVNSQRVTDIRGRIDHSGEVSAEAFENAERLTIVDRVEECAKANYIVIAVPTPVDDARRPDFGPLVSACRSIGNIMSRGTTVIFESTVYPGATEEVCVPVLEEQSGLKWKREFFVAYSPERVNPGDSERTLEKITKLVAGDTAQTCAKVAELYSAVIEAGVYKVDSIQIGEAAKVIENTQRDLNIALVNELAIIFDRLGLDTNKVLEAAGTKWNFLPFRPGLVGGHCIGVDPYYLTFKAQMLGYHPEVILAGRRINDGMGKFVAENTVKTMLRAGIELRSATVNILGITFKENCPDLRNSQVFEVIKELRLYGLRISVCDPVASADEARDEYGLELLEWDRLPRANALLLAVAHQEFLDSSGILVDKLSTPGALIDVKSVVDYEALQDQGITVWRL